MATTAAMVAQTANGVVVPLASMCCASLGLDACGIARDLIPLSRLPTSAILCALATLVDKLVHCTAISKCYYYWVVIALFFGFRRPDPTSHEAPSWMALVSLNKNFSSRIATLRFARLALARRKLLHLYGNPIGPTERAATEASVLLLYADSGSHLNAPHVAPFLRHLRCYADFQGMRFVVDTEGPRVRHVKVGMLNVNINPAQGEFVFSTRDLSEVAEDTAKKLIDDLLHGQLERLNELVNVEDTFVVSYGNPLHFGRVWAMEDTLRDMAPGALQIYFDTDVTIRPDRWDLGLTNLLLDRPMVNGEQPHIFVADTWAGIECVNSGFLALRNTKVASLFLELWKEKIQWATFWDQAALAETVLEIIGMEQWKLTHGNVYYDSRCLSLLSPLPDRSYAFGMYCTCWSQSLEHLVGPYRSRRSRIVRFVDPEHAELNFIPNDLFYDHDWKIEKMNLVPRPGRALLKPLVVHWAGLGPRRLKFMKEYFGRAFNMSPSGCPNSRGLLGRGSAWQSRVGTKSRHLRCCEKLNAHSDRLKWPWTHPLVEEHIYYWGCSQWQAVTEKDCEELLGAPIIFTNE
eukprot:TRINITY_DN61870_c0_g1_i1.p1 TRINITY_DN61870_c0_g1~~TRINITY_DN61870_c0_g1_i1.p1  ORF type:complete len:575 (+),score=53.38 TRINITY_DN61870_c0_g1_i1:59-1783(+)